jgi:hypothetical protein
VKFKALQDNLRKAVRDRIESGDLTGLHLAHQTGFRQAHISNFLNRKRSLSLAGMDKVLQVQHFSILDLIDPVELNKRASIPPPSEDDFENVLLVEGEIASEPHIMNRNVREIVKFKRGFLRKLRPEMEGNRSGWERFVLIRADGREGMSMYPRLMPGATVLVDRHYNSLKPYRRNDSNMSAVIRGGTCTLKYVEISGRNLVLRPQNSVYPVEVMPMAEGKAPAHYIIGRICHVGIET